MLNYICHSCLFQNGVSNGLFAVVIITLAPILKKVQVHVRLNTLRISFWDLTLVVVFEGVIVVPCGVLTLRAALVEKAPLP